MHRQIFEASAHFLIVFFAVIVYFSSCWNIICCNAIQAKDKRLFRVLGGERELDFKAYKKHASLIFNFENCVCPTTWTWWFHRHNCSKKHKRHQATWEVTRWQQQRWAESRESTEQGEGSREGNSRGEDEGQGRRDEMVREESADRNRWRCTGWAMARQRGEEVRKKTVNNGTSVKMPEKLEGWEEKKRDERSQLGEESQQWNTNQLNISFVILRLLKLWACVLTVWPLVLMPCEAPMLLEYALQKSKLMLSKSC